MKTFKDFLGPITEIVGIAPKAKGEHKFVHTTYLAQTKDPGDLEKVGPEEVGPKDTKSGQGKRPADRLDNKQKFAEAHDDNEDHMEKEDEKDEEEKQRMMTGKKKSLKSFKESLGIDEADSHQAKTTMKHISNPNAAEKKAAKDIKPGIKGVKDRLDMLQAAKNRGALKDEVDLTAKQTKMAHTIGKEFDKKNVGDKSKGGPYAVATSMVINKPEAAQKAYNTIKSKMKEDVDSELLMKLYDDLSEENQNLFMVQLEEDADALLVFAQNLLGE
jgi:hypothetical protein